MTAPSILHPILYAGLGGTLLALIVATASNRWSLRVFFLLALRLAIGWHFLFEGLHKIHSHEVGPTETNKPFSSEIYFKVAPGPLGAQMRKQFDDPTAVIAARVKPTRGYSPEAFAKLTVTEQADACPEAVAAELDHLPDTIKADEERILKAVTTAEQKGVSDAKTDGETEAVKKAAESAREVVTKQTADSLKTLATTDIPDAKARYARWVYGVDRRPTKVKFVTGDVSLTAPERLAHLEVLRQEVKTAEDRQAAGLGNGYGIDGKKAAELRSDLVAAETELAKDAISLADDLKKELGAKDVDAIVDDVKKALNSGKEAIAFVDAMKKELITHSMGQRMDKVTMWFLVVVGGCLLAGLCTRISCVLGAGFLVMTYLAHPPFPWYPLPPNTEGNPVFINKNVIECLALLALASMPTGRWLGLDALIGRLCGCRRSADPAA